MLIYYAAIFGAALGAFSALKFRPVLRYVIAYVVVYAGVFAFIAYGYLTLTARGS